MNGAKEKCPAGTYGSTQGLYNESCTAPCPLGHYCPEGTGKGMYDGPKWSGGSGIKCPSGRYGGELGLKDKGCSGPCDEGYFCPPGSSSPTQEQCGSLAGLLYSELFRRSQMALESIAESAIVERVDELIDEVSSNPSNCINTIGYLDSGGDVKGKVCNRTRTEALEILGNMVYCREGSRTPIVTLPGYYSIGGNATTRRSQLPCPHGAYCDKGVVRDCPAGTYGEHARLETSSCSGLCNKGFYCPAGSTRPVQYACPIGRYGATRGLKTAACTDSCTHPLDCNEGSIHDGYLPHEHFPSVW